jgi:hypothetical protein
MPNPYLQDQANNISANMTRNFQSAVMPGINQGAMAAGGFGGSRQGIAQGLGMRGLNDSIGQAQTSLYSNAYNTDQQIDAQKSMQAAQLAQQQRIAEMSDATQRMGLSNQFNLGMGQLGLGNRQADQSFALGQGNLALGNTQASNQFNLGMGQLGLGAMQANQNFFNTQRGLDLSQMGLGQSMVNNANTGLTNQGQQLTQVGQTQQNAPWQQLGNFANTLSPFSGLGQSSSVTTPGASTVGSAMGGALTAAQIWQLISGGK